MNDVVNNPPTNTPDVNDQLAQLRWQVNFLFFAIVVASFTLTAFLGLQARRASMDLGVVRAQRQQAANAVQQDDAAIKMIYGRLSDFSRTHPDFAQILSKYKLAGPATSNAPATSLPAAPPKK